ncbi:MAG: Do family serine endopeptidase [Gammaproteobacteria bacterium]
MKPQYLLIAALIAAAPAVSHADAIPGQLDGVTLPSLAPMLQRATPGVVNISTSGTVQVQRNPMFNDPFFRRFFNMPEQPSERPFESLGSGVVVDAKNGYVLTNNHVVANATEISITLQDGRELSAEVVGTDAPTDLALLKVEAVNLTALPLADSDQLQVGDFVVAIGNPFGLGQTVTSGIVSGLGRALGLRQESYENFIQTDAAINRGNSGGALVNLRGELVGINTAILSGSGGNIGIGFAIPTSMVKYVMGQLIEHGKVSRGVLGVTIQNLSQELATAMELDDATQGVVVSSVASGSAAEKAGIQVGDVIVGLNGRAVSNLNELRNRLGMMPVGERVRVELLRDGRRQTVTATISELAATELTSGTLHSGLDGASFSDIPETSALSGRVQGAMIVQVEEGSTAQRNGLLAGDVVTSVNRRPITSVEDLRRLAAPGQQQLLLNVRRGNGALFIVIR